MSECAKCGLQIEGYPEEEYCMCGYKGRIAKLEAELVAAQSHNGKCVECGKWTCGFCGMHNSKGEWRCEVCHHGSHVCGATETLPKLEANNARLQAELTARDTECTIYAMIHNTNVNSLITQHEQTIYRLRECLKRLEWCVGFGVRKKCMICYGMAPDTRLPDENPDRFGHDPDCWLAAEIGGKEK